MVPDAFFAIKKAGTATRSVDGTTAAGTAAAATIQIAASISFAAVITVIHAGTYFAAIIGCIVGVSVGHVAGVGAEVAAAECAVVGFAAG